MSFWKKEQLVGLDIGSRTIKVGEVIETRKDGLVLNKFGMATISSGSIQEGGIKDSKTVAAVIREMFHKNRIKEKNVAISIGGYSVIVKKIQVNTMTDDELMENIQVEAEKYIPFDIKDANLDFHIMGESPSVSGKMDVILVAAKKEFINDVISTVELAGLKPCVIDVDVFALQNIYEANYDHQEDVVALIDIGASKTTMNIVKDGLSLFTRNFSLGCNQADHKIADKIQCSLEDAEAIRTSRESNKISSREISSVISSVINNWRIEIRRALDYFYSSSDDHIKKIMLSGGGANIADFRNILAAETALEVEVLNPLNRFSIHKALSPSFLEQIAPQAAICMGLAIRRAGDK